MSRLRIGIENLTPGKKRPTMTTYNLGNVLRLKGELARKNNANLRRKAEVFLLDSKPLMHDWVNGRQFR